jgi:DNA invertase Pin-like site-specific DNA recombinase
MQTQLVLIYARASKDPKEQKISVDRQLKLCSERAQQLWPDAEIKPFRDDGITAADPGVHRPGFAGFLSEVRAARQGEIVGDVVNEQSRLTRQGNGAWDDLVVTLTKAGVTKVETLRAGPVSVEPGDRLVGRLLAVIDAEEVERTKARVQAAHRELFKEGRPSGRAPFGYMRGKDADGRTTFVPDPVEGPLVTHVFDWLIEGYAISVIVDRLNASGVPPRAQSWTYKDGRQVTGWKANAVRKLLQGPTVAGLRGHTDADGVLHTVPGRWEALVDVDKWERVQRMLGQPTTVIGANGETYRVRTKPAPQPRRYLLSGGRRRSGVPGQPGEEYGILRCGKCKHALVAQTQGRKSDGARIPGYACHPKADPDACGGVSITPADRVERLVVEAIQSSLAASPKLRARLNATHDADAARWRVERDAARVRMLDASALLGAGTIDRDSFDVMHSAAKSAYDAAELRLASVASDTTLPSVDDVINRWGKLTLSVQRAVVEHLIERIEVAPGYSGRPGFNSERLGKPTWRA